MCVALLAEGVDRNFEAVTFRLTVSVALLAEGVDRNCAVEHKFPVAGLVALLAEGVDRNERAGAGRRRCNASPSSRRAWIEMEGLINMIPGVDRNP